MSPESAHEVEPRWQPAVEKFEEVVIAALAFLIVVIIAVTLAVATYLFVSKVGVTITGVSNMSELQGAALRASSGILLVLLGLELLDTVKVYFREHSVRVEVILLVGLIAMGRHVLEIDLHHIEPLVLLGFATLTLVLAISYFLIKRAQIPAIGLKRPSRGRMARARPNNEPGVE